MLASLRSDPPAIANLAGSRLLRLSEVAGDYATLVLAAKACIKRGFHEEAASRSLAIAYGAVADWYSFEEVLATSPALRDDPIIAALAVRSARARSLPSWRETATSLLLDAEWGHSQVALITDAELMEDFAENLSKGDAAFLKARIALGAREYGRARVSFQEMAEGEGAPGRIRYWRDAYRAFLYDGAYKAGLEFFAKTPQGNEPAGIEFVRRFAVARYLEALNRAKEAIVLYREAMDAAFEPGQRIDSAFCALRANLSLGPASALRGLNEFLSEAGGVAGCQSLIEELLRSLVWEGRWSELRDVARIIAMDTSPGQAAVNLRARAAYLSIRVGEMRFGLPSDAAREAYRLFADSSDALHDDYYRFLALSRAGSPGLDSTRGIDERASAAYGSITEEAPVTEINPILQGFFDFGQLAELITFFTDGSLPMVRDEAIVLLSALASGGEHTSALVFAARCVERGVLRREEAIPWLFPRPWKDAFEAEALASGLPEAMLYALVRVESAFDPRAVSSAGAKGLTQLMDTTAQEESRKLKIASFDPFDPILSIKVGASFFADQRRRRGSLWLASLAYNGGPTRMLRLKAEKPSLPPDLFIEGVPVPESRHYARKMLVAYCYYRYVYAGELFGKSALAFMASD